MQPGLDEALKPPERAVYLGRLDAAGDTYVPTGYILTLNISIVKIKYRLLHIF